MTNSLNKVIFTGNMATEVELIKKEKVTIAIFTLAVNRSYKDKDGNWINEVDYATIKSYGNLAEYIAKKGSIGTRVELTGSYRKKAFEVDGQNRSEIFIELDRKADINLESKKAE
jgi:single-strand DNA-binding protein